MHRRTGRFWRMLILPLVLAVASPAAHAGKPRPVPQPVGSAEQPALGGYQPTGEQASCLVGASGTSSYTVDYILPPDDAYYELLRVENPSTCPTCYGQQGVAIHTAHVRLQFPTLSCQQNVEISIVGAVGDTSCRRPDTTTTYTSPQVFTLIPGSTAIEDFALSLPQLFVLNRDAFLCVRFLSSPGGCEVPVMPRLVTLNGCTKCRTYNHYPGGRDDLCDVVFPGNPILYAAGDSCFTLDVPRDHSPGVPALRLLAPRPNPGWGRTTIAYDLSTPTPVTVRILDVSGRTVRALDAGTVRPAGQCVQAWDGLDDRGRAVLPGVYFIQVRAGRENAARPVLLLR